MADEWDRFPDAPMKLGGPAMAAARASVPPANADDLSGSAWADNLPRYRDAQDPGDATSSWRPMKPDFTARDDNSFRPQVPDAAPGYPHPTTDGQQSGFRQKVSDGGYEIDGQGRLVLHIGGHRLEPVDKPDLGDIPLRASSPVMDQAVQTQQFRDTMSQPDHPRVPVSGASGPHGQPVYPDERDIPIPLATRVGRHALGIAQTMPMVMGMTGGPAGAIIDPIKRAAEPVVAAAGRALTASPTTAAVAAGGTALLAGGSEAGPETEEAVAVRTAGKQLYEERARLQQQLDTAVARREAARPAGRVPNANKDPIFSEANNEVLKLEAQRDANKALIDRHTHMNSPEYALEMKQKEADAVEQARLKRAATPTRELYSDYMPYLYPIGGAVALAGGVLLRGRSIASFNTEIADISTRWSQAVQRAQSAAPTSRVAQSAATEARGLLEEYAALRSNHEKFFDPGMKKALAFGATEGVTVAFSPEEIDFARAVSGSPLWDSLKKNVIEDWPNTAKRAVIAGTLGALTSMAGAEMAGPFMNRPIPPGYGPATNGLPPPRQPNGPQGGGGVSQPPPARTLALPAPASSPASTPPDRPSPASPSRSAPANENVPVESWRAPSGDVIQRAEDGVRWRNKGQYSPAPPKGSKRLSELDSTLYMGGFA